MSQSEKSSSARIGRLSQLRRISCRIFPLADLSFFFFCWKKYEPLVVRRVDCVRMPSIVSPFCTTLSTASEENRSFRVGSSVVAFEARLTTVFCDFGNTGRPLPPADGGRQCSILFTPSHSATSWTIANFSEGEGVVQSFVLRVGVVVSSVHGGVFSLLVSKAVSSNSSLGIVPVLNVTLIGEQRTVLAEEQVLMLSEYKSSAVGPGETAAATPAAKEKRAKRLR